MPSTVVMVDVPQGMLSRETEKEAHHDIVVTSDSSM